LAGVDKVIKQLVSLSIPKTARSALLQVAMSFKKEVAGFVPPVALHLYQNFTRLSCPNQVNISG
jgi:hypothetical protein